MDLKEIKKLVHFARKAGVKTISVNGLAIEFHADAVQVPVRRLRSVSKEPKLPEPIPGPTLDDINKFIYSDEDSA